MNKPAELTISSLRRKANIDDSEFLDLYEKIVNRSTLSEQEFINLLKFAILFLRSDDEIVSRLGYRIILLYSVATEDYEPLRDVAQSRDLIPIVAAIDRINRAEPAEESFARLLQAAHNVNFVTRDSNGRSITRTRGQMELRTFNAREKNATVVAPTSYGKSEMLVDKVAERTNSRTLILVPTRALISQTRAAVIGDERIRSVRLRVITHPDAYTGEEAFAAVMTQERAHRLLIDNPSLRVDQILVDEAHNLLDNESRSIELSQVILTARARNADLAVTYYTPFMSEPSMLRHVNGVDDGIRDRVVNEHVKSEFIVHAPLGRKAELYDQYLDRTIELPLEVPSDELSAVLELSGHRTLVYVNRPREAQGLAEKLSTKRGRAELTPEALRAIRAIGDLIDPEYSLISAIESGLIFHHGQVPDLLRQYIENLFRNDSSAEGRLMVTTSSLLEGVNTPADRLLMMSPSRGQSYLSRSGFRNLIGRVGRFSEVFSPNRTDLELLLPRVYLIPSSYARHNWNVVNYLSRVANLSTEPTESAENPLLEASGDSEARTEALEYLENIEPGSSGVDFPRLCTTEVGTECFKHGVRDFDIFAHEDRIQARIELMRASGVVLSSTRQIVDAICDTFLSSVELDQSDDLSRIRDNDGARRFYAAFMDWRSNNEPFKRLIARFLRYWSQLDQELVYVGKRWGEEKYGDSGFRELYVRMGTKSRAQRVNLAVVKIKEEQDFVDFRIVKYVEILNSLGFISNDLHNRLKFGTADPAQIAMLRNGFSPELARIVRDNYFSRVAVNIATNMVRVSPSLPEAMMAQDENDILVYEASTLVNDGLPL